MPRSSGSSAAYPNTATEFFGLPSIPMSLRGAW